MQLASVVLRTHVFLGTVLCPVLFLKHNIYFECTDFRNMGSVDRTFFKFPNVNVISFLCRIYILRWQWAMQQSLLVHDEGKFCLKILVF